MKPEVSIIIPTWNTATTTLKCVNTIKKYLSSNFAQIIIVDNDSTDNTYELFSGLKDIDYIKNKSNFGFSKASNIGSQKAKADYLFFLNSDMEIVDDHLKEMLGYLKNNPKIGLIGPRFLNPDLSIQGSIFPDQSVTNAFREYYFHQSSYSKYYLSSNSPTKVWAISGGAVLINKHLFNRVGQWNEKYYMYYEDLDLCRSLRNISKDIYYYPQFKVIHRHGVSGQKLADSQNQWRRLIPGSIKYHGLIRHYLINFVIWSSQKFFSPVTK